MSWASILHAARAPIGPEDTFQAAAVGRLTSRRRVNMAHAQVSYEVPVEYEFNCEILESSVGKVQLMDP
jgi:hypothetical protein